MKDLFQEIGSLEVVVGRGTISAFEVAKLEVGNTVVVTDRDSGSAVDVLFNGHTVGSGEIMFLDGRIFGVRVVEVTRNRPQIPFAGTADDVTELLEFSLRIASTQVTFGELVGVGDNTIINLGTPIDAEDQLTLFVAGIEVAQGAICNMGNRRFGMKVHTIVATIQRQLPIHTTGVLSASEPRERPLEHQLLLDRFSKDQVRNVSFIHERFASNLGSAFEQLSEWIVLCVDQTSYRDLIDNWMANNTFTLLELKLRGDLRDAHINRKFFVQPQSIDHVLNDESVERIEASQREIGASVPLGKILLGYPEHGTFASAVVRDTDWATVLTSLRNSWKLRYTMAYPEYRSVSVPELDARFTDLEHFLISQIGVRDSDDLITIAYPSAYVERIASLLD